MSPSQLAVLKRDERALEEVRLSAINMTANIDRRLVKLFELVEDLLGRLQCSATYISPYLVTHTSLQHIIRACNVHMKMPFSSGSVRVQLAGRLRRSCMQGKSAARQDAVQPLSFGPGSEGEQGAAMGGMLGCSSPDLATPSAPRPPVRSSASFPWQCLLCTAVTTWHTTLLGIQASGTTARQQCLCRAPTKDGGM